MGALADIGKRFLTLPETEWMQEIIKDNSEQIEDLNTGQLDEGFNAEGDLVGRYRSESYATFKQSLNSKPPKGVPDLKLTGRFQRSFKTDVFADRFQIDATDPKRDELVEKYTKEIFGLTEESQEDLKVLIKDELEEKIRNYLL